MRTLLLAIFLVISFNLLKAQSVVANDISQKWAKVTKEELEMSVYNQDTSASAVVMYQHSYTNYDFQTQNGYSDYTTNGFLVNTYISRKIKILKEQGKEVGTIEIPYYFYSNSSKESVTDIEAWTYNLENGKMVKSKLDKQYLFDEEYNDVIHLIKFSMPDVRVGSVIEIKYTLLSKSASSIPDWNIQRNIPVMNSEYEVGIPEFYDFSLSVKGFEMLDIKETSESMTYNIVSSSYGTDKLSSVIRKIKCKGQDIPALKSEKYVWCMNDFFSGVRFELRGTRYPNKPYIPFTSSWETLEKVIYESPEIAMNLKMGNPWKAETSKLVAGVTDEAEKISILYEFVKKQIRWNEHYALFSGMPRDAIRNGTGNNSQINFVLMSVLRDEGINTYPILISHRSNGRLPLTNASINMLSTFIVAAMTKDSTVFYLDGSSKNGGPNLLPTNLLVDRARILNKSSIEKWVDLTKLTPNLQMSYIQASIDKNGLVQGTRTTSYINQEAYEYKTQFSAAKDSLDFVKNEQNKYDIILDSLEISGKEPSSSSVNEQMSFSKQMDVAGDFIYVNTMIFKHLSDNPFSQIERKFPVEFDYSYSYQVECSLQIPDGYQVEELPKSVKYKLPGNAAFCQFMAGQSGNTVIFKYVFQLSQIVYLQDEYSMIREFYGQVAAKNLEMMVLKKRSL